MAIPAESFPESGGGQVNYAVEEDDEQANSGADLYGVPELDGKPVQPFELDAEEDEPNEEQEETKARNGKPTIDVTVRHREVDPINAYFKQIGKTPLLKKEQEVLHAKTREAGILAQELIARYENGDPLDTDDLLEKVVENSLIKSTELSKTDLLRMVQKGRESNQLLIEANLRLVVSIAKKHVGRGLLLLDLIQEGNLGLMRAVEKFDYRKGFKFSTYATWWIRQAITRGIAYKGRSIRLPVHVVERVNKMSMIQKRLTQELEREPTIEELVEALPYTQTEVENLLKVAPDVVSLEEPVGDAEGAALKDFLEDEIGSRPDEIVEDKSTKEQATEVLETLSERERKVLELRLGLGEEDEEPKTLEDIGKEFGVTRERIRQIQSRSLAKIRSDKEASDRLFELERQQAAEETKARTQRELEARREQAGRQLGRIAEIAKKPRKHTTVGRKAAVKNGLKLQPDSPFFGLTTPEIADKLEKQAELTEREADMVWLRHGLGLSYEAIGCRYEKDAPYAFLKVQKAMTKMGQSREFSEIKQAS